MPLGKLSPRLLGLSLSLALALAGCATQSATPSTPAVSKVAASNPPATPAAWSPDLGDGNYKNPVIFADYSDPDIIRVGESFYLTASSFTAAPGLPVLRSPDLVNWTIIGHALARNVPAARFDTVTKLGGGVWAPAIRFHAGKFYIYYPDPDEGIYVVTATDPAGPWAAPVMVKAGKGLIDPCPLWDDDGKVWLVHAWANSRSGRSNLLTLLPLSADGTKPTGDGKDIILGPSFNVTTLEGPKFYKFKGYYWIFAPVGGVGAGPQAVFRSKTIEGPYEHRDVLAQGGSTTNGPHQGGLVDTPDGQQWWFIHFSDTGVYGRVSHLEPVVWRDDGWPVMGDDPNHTGKGTPVLTHQKPQIHSANLSRSLSLNLSPSASDSNSATAVPQTSDEFNAPELGLQWQWAANPQPAWFSLTAKPGMLRLFPQPKAASLSVQPNLLLEKFPATEFRVTTQLDASGLASGEQAGLAVWSAPAMTLGVGKTATVLHLSQVTAAGGGRGNRPGGDAGAPAADVNGPSVILALTITRGPGTGPASQADAQFSYSEDGKTFTNLGGATPIKQIAGAWMGAKFGLFTTATATINASDHADFDWLHVTPLEK